ncbi:sugar phosphate isomerase/epimerase family protein [Bacillus sp. ISL-39]|uniref:sugar phosphate isomerase/epimerase family protein n=1 Tax=Bacillus sp. ISL-39 TaxID=2819124 RepID=UPI001BE5CBA5|nr:sugar phosphate isomerase/epimerase family protein [Bacillus sp. ISL-39]MBT2636644.1 sugar phosphate isomerase/epimerase [Bacillus sp. ISL-39]
MNKLGMFLHTRYIDIIEGIKLANKLKVDGIQIYALNDNFSLINFSTKEVSNLFQYISSQGLEVSALAINFGINGLLTENPEKLVEQYKRIVDIGKMLNSNIITAHIGEIPRDSNQKEYEQMFEMCNTLGIISAQMESRFAIETGSEEVEVLINFLDSVKSSGLAVNYDPANIIMSQKGDPIESIKVLRRYLVHTHMKDCKKGDKRNPTGFTETLLGDGDINFPSILESLKEIDYSGYLTIERNEYINMDTGMEQSMKNFRKYKQAE